MGDQEQGDDRPWLDGLNIFMYNSNNENNINTHTVPNGGNNTSMAQQVEVT